jgi:hypothetical protein
VWLVDRAEATAPAIERTGLADRLGLEGDASRLGVALRPAQAGDTPRPPIATWPYTPPYLPAGMSISVAASSRVLGEPLLFFVPAGRRWELPDRPHPNGARRVTDVVIQVLPQEVVSPELEWLRTSGCVRVERGALESLTLELDGGVQGRVAPLDPHAPLALRW